MRRHSEPPIASGLTSTRVELKRASQDGMPVRASAGAGSFWRKGRLKRRLAAARECEERGGAEHEAGQMTLDYLGIRAFAAR